MDEKSYKSVVDLYHKFGDRDDFLKIFYTNDYPIPFKGLTIYPVNVSLFYLFNILVDCLLIPHRTSGDIKVISMNYLQFLYYLATEKGQPDKLEMLLLLLLMVLKKERTFTDKQGKEKDTIFFSLDDGRLFIEDVAYDGKDFDFIRKLILEQNGRELPDETIDPEALKAFEEIEEMRRKQMNIKICGLEEQINVLVAKTAYKREEVLEMTIRSFSRILARVDKIMDYEINSLLRPYMEAKDQKKIGHYLEDTEKTFKEKYQEAMTDIGSLDKKLNG